MTSSFHILNGDCLAETFPDSIKGTRIVFREMLIEGPKAFSNLNQFLDDRQSYLEHFYDVKADKYNIKTRVEVEQLLKTPPKSNIYLWFEYDLFCQVNLIFILFLLKNHLNGCTYNVVHPLSLPEEKLWQGFGALTPKDLKVCFLNARKITLQDMEYAVSLWLAYSSEDVKTILHLSDYHSHAFPHSGSAFKAYLESLPSNNHHGRLKIRLNELIQEYGHENFNTIFREFQKTEGIYGFGDLQVSKMIKEIS